MEQEQMGTVLEQFLEQRGISEEQAVMLLEAAMDKQDQVMQRARQVMAAMEAIGDDGFSVESLRANPEAMRAVEDGMPVGEVYRQFYLKRGAAPRQETNANLGLSGVNGDNLTPEEIERISQYVSRTGKRYDIG